MGGSEIIYNNIKNSLPDYFNDINLIISRTDLESIDSSKKNVLMQQLDIDQPAVQNITNPAFYNKINHIVFVSNWQCDRFRNKFNIWGEKSSVIKNAAHKVDKNYTKPQKIKLIYTSTPWRGLNVLLEAFKLISHKEVELDLYTSTKIYGAKFYEENDKEFYHLYEMANSMPNVTLHGYADNKTIYEALQNSHILAYPSIFQETSCIAAIEAAMCGCVPVVTNFGALYETLGDWGRYVQIDNNMQRLVTNYAKKLEQEIDNYWSEETQKRLHNQKIYYDKFYSWEARIPEWKNLFDQVLGNR